MGTGPTKPVAPLPLKPPQISLLSSADVTGFPNDGGTERATRIAWEPLLCSSGGTADPCDVDDRTLDTCVADLADEPFVIWTGRERSAFGFEGIEYEVRTKEALTACESFLIERELWSGAQAAASGWDENQHLAEEDSSDVISAAPEELSVALSLLEEALATQGCGSNGLIHATVGVVSQWASLHLLERVDDHLETILGNIVIPGAGYDGSSPIGVPAVDGSVWAYATDPILIYLSKMDVTPEGFEEAHDRATNTISFIAQRQAAIQWDRCRHFAVEIDAQVPDIGGPGS